MLVTSLQIGKIATYTDAGGTAFRTATYKQAVSGPLALGIEGFEGDQHANRRFHGGPDKAALVYSHDHYPDWEADSFGQALPPGAFGENILVRGATESTVCIGDVYQLGSATTQVSQPRQPCVTQNRRWDMPDLVSRMAKSLRSGWYLRVLRPGVVNVGDTFTLSERPHPEWTVAEAFTTLMFRKKDRDAVQRLYDLPALSKAWKRETE